MPEESKHFSKNELKCPHCDECDMDHDFMVMLEKLREIYGAAIHLNSGYRCEQHNKDVGGVLNSAHCRGKAVDIRINGEDAFYLLGIAFTVGFTGIGIKQHGKYKNRFIHLDSDMNRKRPRVWNYT